MKALIAEIARQVSDAIGGGLDLESARPIPRPEGKEEIADSTLALTIDGAAGGLVILVSNPRFPQAVAEDVARARAVAEAASALVARHIVRPLATGAIDGRSWTAMARLSPMSENRLVRLVQKTLVAPQVTDWAADLAVSTRRDVTGQAEADRLFRAPLAEVAGHGDVPTAMRRAAEGALATQPLWTCAEHTDFWFGNVLFDPGWTRNPARLCDGFTVIDWRGSRDDGYPCADIMRFVGSTLKPGARRAEALLARYRAGTGLSRTEMGLYTLASLGRLAQALEEFPPERYAGMARKLGRFLEAHALLPD